MIQIKSEAYVAKTNPITAADCELTANYRDCGCLCGRWVLIALLMQAGF